MTDLLNMTLITRLLLLLTLSTLLCCNNKSDSEENYVYFGGEIINPNNDYVILTSPNDKSDTIYLNEKNRFIIKLTDVKPGVYTFIHGENQRILLEPKDSVMVRLNTIDFDESLVFTGEGARKNNYLISAFLQNEEDNKRLMRLMWDMEPNEFEQVLNDVRNKKLLELQDFLSKKEYSELFKSIAESNINYDYYYYKELYPFSYYGYNNLIHYKDLPEGFYDFRSDINYNDENLVGVIPYYKFLFYHFNNLALTKYYENATHNMVFDKKSAVYNLEKLRLMDSLITNKTIKNYLLKFTTRDFVAVSNDSTEVAEVLNLFLEKSTSEADKIYIRNIVNSVNKLKSGNDLPNLKLLSSNNTEVDIINVINKPTVIYFWSSNLPLLLRNTQYRVKTLKSKFPGINFLAININDDDPEHWRTTLNQHKLSKRNEYHFVNPSEAMNQLAISSVNRSILVDANAKIINSNAMLFTTEFEDELESIIHNKKAYLLE